MIKWVSIKEGLPEVEEGMAFVKVIIADGNLIKNNKPYPYEIVRYYPKDVFRDGRKIVKKGWQSSYTAGLPPKKYDPIAWAYLPLHYTPLEWGE